MEKGTSILLIALIVVSLLGLVLFFSEGGFGGGGRGYGVQAIQNSFEQRSIWLVVFAVPLSIALVVAAYALLFPKIRIETGAATVSPPRTVSASNPEPAPASVEKSQTLEAVLRVLNCDEQKVVDAIATAEGGAMLQKDIKLKTGLSRVKTHRVLARLVARRIVNAEKYYNTNRIVLAEWITNNKETHN